MEPSGCNGWQMRHVENGSDSRKPLPWFAINCRRNAMVRSQIAERLGVCRPTVIARRKRYSQEGLSGRLADRHRRGRLQTVRRTRCAEILAATLTRHLSTLA